MKCSCYHTRTKTTYLDPATVAYLTGKWPEDNGIIKSDEGECWGTKERDVCDCGGDERKCDFYEDVRNKANKSASNPFKVIVNSKIDYLVNDRIYNEGEILDVHDIEGFPNEYAYYYTRRINDDRVQVLDWIPKCMVSNFES